MGEEACSICHAEEARYHGKWLYALGTIYEANDLVKFYVGGMGSTLFTMNWANLTQHCPAGSTMPIAANSWFYTFLSDAYMNAQSPQIPYVGTIKHPLSLAPEAAEIPHGFYQPAELVVERLDLYVVFAGNEGEEPPAIVIPAEAKYLRQVPALRCGFVEKLELTPAAITELVLPKYPGMDPASFAGKKASIVDVRLSFDLKDGAKQEDRSLFDGNSFHPEHPEELPIGTTTSLLLHGDYLRYLRVA
jgi:hypothetical protein